MDLFVVPTIGFDLLCLRHRPTRSQRPRLDQRHNKPTAGWIARQITRPSLGTMPQIPDPRSGSNLWRGRHTPMRAMGIRDKPTAPASPWQNGFAERLIGSIRGECVDHIIVLGEAHLRRILKSYADYYNRRQNSSIPEQRCAGLSPGSANRSVRSRAILADFITATLGLGFRYTQDRYIAIPTGHRR